MSNFEFKPKEYPVITKKLIKDILRNTPGMIRTSLSLGKTWSKFRWDGNNLYISSDIRISLKELYDKLDPSYIYVIDTKLEKIYKVALYANNLYYKLLPVNAYIAPTLEISGIRMHRTEGITPWINSYQKVRAISPIKGKKVLDLCSGLGYTAIHSLKFGAKHITTIEKDPNVLEMASFNPWSAELANRKVKIILADAYEYISKIDDSTFDVIIHDPPRLARAGNLYSTEFYKELYRVLKDNGRLFHYTGKPRHKVRHMNLMSTVARRLQLVGFKTVIKRNLLGVIAYKK